MTTNPRVLTHPHNESADKADLDQLRREVREDFEKFLTWAEKVTTILEQVVAVTHREERDG